MLETEGSALENNVTQGLWKNDCQTLCEITTPAQRSLKVTLLTRQEIVLTFSLYYKRTVIM